MPSSNLSAGNDSDPLDGRPEAEMPSALECLSADFDSEHSPQNKSGDRNLSMDDELASHLASWKSLSRVLQELPAERVGDGLQQAVRSEILRDLENGSTVRVAQQPSATGWSGTQVRSKSRVAALLSSTAALIVLLLMARIGMQHKTHQDSVVAQQSVRAAVQNESLLTDSGPDSEPGSSALASEAESESLADSKDWQIVVVSVDDSALARETIKNAVRERGLSFESVRDQVALSDDSEYSLGILASPTASDSLLSLVSEQGSLSQMTATGVEQTTPIDSDEIKRRFVESMKSPTRSDEYFGEMFVVLPAAASQDLQMAGAGIRPLQPQNPGHSTLPDTLVADADSAADLPAADRPSAGAVLADSGDDSAELAEGDSRRPVLVVFRIRKSAHSPTGPESDDHGSRQQPVTWQRFYS
jgi:hypothetical protein